MLNVHHTYVIAYAKDL